MSTTPDLGDRPSDTALASLPVCLPETHRLPIHWVPAFEHCLKNLNGRDDHIWKNLDGSVSAVCKVDEHFECHTRGRWGKGSSEGIFNSEVHPTFAHAEFRSETIKQPSTCLVQEDGPNYEVSGLGHYKPVECAQATQLYNKWKFGDLPNEMTTRDPTIAAQSPA